MVVIDSVGGNHRGVVQTQGAGLELGIVAEADGIGGFREIDVGALAGAVDQANLIQAVHTLLHGDEVRERLKAADVECVGSLQQGRPSVLG